MSRVTPVRILFVLGLFLVAVFATLPTSQAAGKKARDVKMTGAIASVGKDDKSISIGSGKSAKEIKIDANTAIDYVGIDNQDEKKLTVGYFVMAVMGEKDVAKSISLKKTAFGK